MGWSGLDSCSLGYGHVVDCCEHGDEPPRSIEWWGFFFSWGTVNFSKGFCCMELYGFEVYTRKWKG